MSDTFNKKPLDSTIIHGRVRLQNMFQDLHKNKNFFLNLYFTHSYIHVLYFWIDGDL